jgi:glycosidase
MPGLTLESAKEYVGEDGPLDMAFDFDLMKLDFGEAGRWDVGEWTVPDLKEAIARWQRGLADDGWNTLFLNNHDQPRSVSRFGDDEQYRVASAKLLATMLLTLRGTPFVYQGEEIGMTNAPFESLETLRDVDTLQHVELLLSADQNTTYEDIRHIVSHRSRDNARTPVQWSGETHAGFTDGEPWIPVNPNYPDINVEAARADPDSIWHHYRTLIDIRAEYPVFVHGDFDLLLPDHRQLFTYRRTTDEATAHTVLNVSDEPAWLESSVASELDAAELLLGTHATPDGPSVRRELEPYEARVYRDRLEL